MDGVSCIDGAVRVSNLLLLLGGGEIEGVYNFHSGFPPIFLSGTLNQRVEAS